MTEIPIDFINKKELKKLILKSRRNIPLSPRQIAARKLVESLLSPSEECRRRSDRLYREGLPRPPHVTLHD